MSVVYHSHGLLPACKGNVLIFNPGQRQFQAERSTNEVVDRLAGGSAKP